MPQGQEFKNEEKALSPIFCLKTNKYFFIERVVYSGTWF